MKIIVISLKSAVERRKSISRQLDATGLQYQFLDARDGREGAKRFFKGYDDEQFLLQTGRQAVPGEIGCYASHVAAWQMCVADDKPLVVLEDDAQIAANFVAALRQCEQFIEDCGFIRLQTEWKGRKKLVLRADDGFSLYRYSKFPHSAAGYVIMPRVAKVFCRESAVLSAPVDVFMKKFWEHKQPMYGLAPYPVDESVRSRSSIIGDRPKVRKGLGLRVRRQTMKAKWFMRRVSLSHKRGFYWAGN
ncbi:MAG: hypothetical protein HKN77_04055 [Woeseiaceae bacterium]|nr:hypothetical protein [Woeseiaceae bacterium]